MADEIQKLIDETRRLDSVISDRDQHIANLERLGDEMADGLGAPSSIDDWRSYRASERDKTDAE